METYTDQPASQFVTQETPRPSPLQNFYLTFGQRFRWDAHPFLPHTICSPDGWVRVVAHSYSEARRCVVDRIGLEWAFLYSEKYFNPEYFPNGESAVWEVE